MNSQDEHQQLQQELISKLYLRECDQINSNPEQDKRAPNIPHSNFKESLNQEMFQNSQQVEEEDAGAVATVSDGTANNIQHQKFNNLSAQLQNIIITDENNHNRAPEVNSKPFSFEVQEQLVSKSLKCERDRSHEDQFQIIGCQALHEKNTEEICVNTTSQVRKGDDVKIQQKQYSHINLNQSQKDEVQSYLNYLLSQKKCNYEPKKSARDPPLKKIDQRQEDQQLLSGRGGEVTEIGQCEYMEPGFKIVPDEEESKNDQFGNVVVDNNCTMAILTDQNLQGSKEQESEAKNVIFENPKNNNANLFTNDNPRRPSLLKYQSESPNHNFVKQMVEDTSLVEQSNKQFPEELAVVQNIHDIKISPSPQAMAAAAAALLKIEPDKTPDMAEQEIQNPTQNQRILIHCDHSEEGEEQQMENNQFQNKQESLLDYGATQIDVQAFIEEKNADVSANNINQQIMSGDNCDQKLENARLDDNIDNYELSADNKGTPTPNTNCQTFCNEKIGEAFTGQDQHKHFEYPNQQVIQQPNILDSPEIQQFAAAPGQQQPTQIQGFSALNKMIIQQQNNQFEGSKRSSGAGDSAPSVMALNLQHINNVRGGVGSIIQDSGRNGNTLVLAVHENEHASQEEIDMQTEMNLGGVSMRIIEDLPFNMGQDNDLENLPSVIYDNFHGTLNGAQHLLSEQRKIVEERKASYYSAAHEDSKSASGEQVAIRQEGNEAVVVIQSNLRLPSVPSVQQEAAQSQEQLAQVPSNEAVSSQVRQEQSLSLRQGQMVQELREEENKVNEVEGVVSPSRRQEQPAQVEPQPLRLPDQEDGIVIGNIRQNPGLPQIGVIIPIIPPNVHPSQFEPQPALVRPKSRESSSSSDISLSALSSPRSIPDEHRVSKLDDIIDGDQYINNYYCIMKGITWARDSHGLFDYETRHPLKKQMRTETSQVLVRTSKNNELHILPPHQDYKEAFQNQGQLLLKINKIRNHYYLEAPKMPKNDDLLPQYQSDDQPPANQNQENQQLPSDVTERMFLVVRSLKEGEKKLDYKLRKNDIIKLGRVKFKVKEIRIKALEDEKNEKRKKKEKYIKKLKQEEQKKLLNEAAKAADVRRNVFNANQAQAAPAKEPQQIMQMMQPGIPSFRSSIAAADALEGEESFIEVECVMPHDQQKNEQEWKSNKMKQKKQGQAANKNGMLTQRVEGAAEKQVAKAEDATNFDVPNQGFSRHQQIRGINNTTSQNAVDPQPLELGHEDSKQRHEDQKQEENHSYRARNQALIVRSDGEENQLVVQTEQNIHKNKSQNFALARNPSIKKSTIQNQMFAHAVNHTSNRRSGGHEDEQLVTKMDANEQREVTEMAGKQNEEEDLELRDDVECESLNKELPFCRFCWVNETSEENPLLSSCKCRGGVQYVHFSCLKEWVKTKRQAKEHSHISSYVFKQFECEICKTPYPYIFKAAGKRYKLIDLPCLNRPAALPQNRQQAAPSGDYLILESLTLEKNTSRIVHVITPTQATRTVRLGRGHDSDLRINDISVSRQHAVIRFKNDGFYLQDNMSKFGTLVLIRKRLPLSVAITQAVQVGRTVVNFQIKPLPMPNFEVGKFIKSNRVLSEKDKQNEELRKVLVNMQQAEDYIKKQQAEHDRLARTDNFHQRNDYQRRIQQNIHEEEIKIDPSVEQLAQVAGQGPAVGNNNNQDNLRLNVNRILEQNNQRRQELLNYMQNNHGGALNGINGLLQAGQPGAPPLVQGQDPAQARPINNVGAAVQQSMDDPIIDNLPVPDEELGAMNLQVEGHIIQAREPANRQVQRPQQPVPPQGQLIEGANQPLNNPSRQNQFNHQQPVPRREFISIGRHLGESGPQNDPSQ